MDQNMSSTAGAEQLKERVARLIAEEIAPGLQINGGDVEVIEVVDGVARLRMHGVCAGCPSTIMTVIMGIEQELRRRIREIEYVEAVP